AALAGASGWCPAPTSNFFENSWRDPAPDFALVSDDVRASAPSPRAGGEKTMTDREIFFGALDRDDPAERATYLDQACGGDTTVRQRVEALLRSHAREGHFMDTPVVEQLADEGAPALDFLDPSQKPGSLGRLDHFEVLSVVGKGGMGVVLK